VFVKVFRKGKKFCRIVLCKADTVYFERQKFQLVSRYSRFYMLMRGIKRICSEVNTEERLRTQIGRKSSLLQTSRPKGIQYKHGEELSKI